MQISASNRSLFDDAFADNGPERRVTNNRPPSNQTNKGTHLVIPRNEKLLQVAKPYISVECLVEGW